MTTTEGADMASKTYENVGAALADPTSNIARFVKQGKTVMSRNEQVIQQWMETGLTREQAWHKALCG